MKIEHLCQVTPETLREQLILGDVVGVWFPTRPRESIIGTDGVVFSLCGTFSVTEEQLTEVKLELEKSDEQRKAEYLDMRKRMNDG
jgi:hypothetical protein